MRKLSVPTSLALSWPFRLHDLCLRAWMGLEAPETVLSRERSIEWRLNLAPTFGEYLRKTGTCDVHTLMDGFSMAFPLAGGVGTSIS